MRFIYMSSKILVSTKLNLSPFWIFQSSKDFRNGPVPMLLRYFPRIRQPGGRLNKKDGLTRYGDSHVKDKTS